MRLAFNPSTWETKAGGLLNLRQVWSADLVQGLPGLVMRPCLENNSKNPNIVCTMIIEGCWVIWKTRRGSWLSLQGNSLATIEAESELHKIDRDVGEALSSEK